MIRILKATLNPIFCFSEIVESKKPCLPDSDKVSDIIANYTKIDGPQRFKNILKSAYLSTTDYENGEHYSALTDLTSFHVVEKIYRRMARDSQGQQIIKEKPRITDEVYSQLGLLPNGTFGKEYYLFMDGLNFKPSSRPIVKYIPDLQLAYVLQRYKEIHDFIHVLMGHKITVDDELSLKWFQMRQLGLPSATLACLISPILSKDFNLQKISQVITISDKVSFIMNVYYEKLFDKPLVIINLKQGISQKIIRIQMKALIVLNTFKNKQY